MRHNAMKETLTHINGAAGIDMSATARA